MTRRLLLAALAAAAMLLSGAMISAGSRQPSSPPERVSSLTITIVSTMLADEGFGEWGFAALVEADGRRLLFDTGAHDDTVARNFKALGLDVRGVDRVVLSHNHADHTTGLLALRRQFGPDSPETLQTLLVGRGIFWPRVNAGGRVDDRMTTMRKEFEATGGRVTEIGQPARLQPGVWLTGPVPRVHPERNWGGFGGPGKVRSDRGEIEDTVPEDMAMVFQTDQGLVYLFGCGHAGVINTLEHGRKTIDRSQVKTVIGGLHLFPADDAHLAWTASHLKRFGVQQLVGAHCTGVEAVYRIRELAGLARDTCMVGAVGASFSLDKGINPLRIAR